MTGDDGGFLYAEVVEQPRVGVRLLVERSALVGGRAQVTEARGRDPVEPLTQNGLREQLALVVHPRRCRGRPGRGDPAPPSVLLDVPVGAGHRAPAADPSVGPLHAGGSSLRLRWAVATAAAATAPAAATADPTAIRRGTPALTVPSHPARLPAGAGAGRSGAARTPATGERRRPRAARSPSRRARPVAARWRLRRRR